MLGMTSVYSSDKHTRIGGDIGAFIERLGKDAGRDLAIICYEKLAVFCIIEWLSPNKDVFIDMMNLGKSLGNFTRDKATELRRRLYKPITCDETSQFISAGDSDYHHKRQDENAEEEERLVKVSMGE